MKLATYRDGSRDGLLVVVARDLGQACHASAIATRLQQVLDDWNFLSPQLEDLYVVLNQGRARHAFAFEPQRCMAPLPRAYQRFGGIACLNHLDLLRRASGGESTAACTVAPLYQAGSDALLGPRDDVLAPPDADIDFGAEIAVVTGDIAAGVSAAQALEGIRLVLLANAWTLPALAAQERASGFGFVQGMPPAAFSPVAATPDELGAAWAGGRVHLALHSTLNGHRVGAVDAGAAMDFHFGQLIAHAAATRPLGAGTIVGSGPISHGERAQGCSGIAERRAVEMLQTGSAHTGWPRAGDTVRIEMLDTSGASVFGAIEQRLATAPSQR